MENTLFSLADGSLKSWEQLVYSVKNYVCKVVSYFGISQDYMLFNFFLKQRGYTGNV